MPKKENFPQSYITGEKWHPFYAEGVMGWNETESGKMAVKCQKILLLGFPKLDLSANLIVEILNVEMEGKQSQNMAKDESDSASKNVHDDGDSRPCLASRRNSRQKSSSCPENFKQTIRKTSVTEPFQDPDKVLPTNNTSLPTEEVLGENKLEKEENAKNLTPICEHLKSSEKETVDVNGRVRIKNPEMQQNASQDSDKALLANNLQLPTEEILLENKPKKKENAKKSDPVCKIPKSSEKETVASRVLILNAELPENAFEGSNKVLPSNSPLPNKGVLLENKPKKEKTAKKLSQVRKHSRCSEKETIAGRVRIKNTKLLRKKESSNGQQQTKKLIFSAENFGQRLRNGGFTGSRCGSGAKQAMAAVIESVTADLLKISGVLAKKDKKNAIEPRHIAEAVLSDPDFAQLLRNVHFPNNPPFNV